MLKDHVSGLHILRRTFATELFDKGYPIKRIAEYLGFYVHVSLGEIHTRYLNIWYTVKIVSTLDNGGRRNEKTN